ncbi:MAG TPA: hypothetical protein VLM17_03800 [Xanthomonadaceae bacterium]|nr:hypothetical protein [Xanthomonadaceae bacterium]
MAWTRAELEDALSALDRDIDPLRTRASDMEAFWAEFEENARHIQREADRDIWYAAAQIDRMLIRHGLMPRPGVYRLPRRSLPFASSDDGGVRVA